MTRKGLVMKKTNGNGKKIKLRNGRERSFCFNDLPSSLQSFISHRAVHPDNLSDTEVKAFWDQVRDQSTQSGFDLDIDDVPAMRRIMASGVTRRKHEIRKGLLIQGRKPALIRA